MPKIQVFYRFLIVWLALGLSACPAPQKQNAPGLVAGPQSMLIFDPAAVNAPSVINNQYLIMVSIDGYRYDFNRLFGPPTMNQMASEGVVAESLRPVYPSKTFPNHYSLVTGLYADHHGIVSNEFFDPARDQTYSLPDRKAVEDGSWYFGEPIWTTAGKQGMLSASFFWVGSEANIQGTHPNYFFCYDDAIPSETRVDQVLAWLKLPQEKRPHFITLYFESVDTAAHRYGVNSPQTREAVMQVDKMLARLRDGVGSLGLPVNIVVVSDHGMIDLDAKKVVVLDERPEAARILAKFQAVGRGPQMLLYLNKGEGPNVVGEAERILTKGAKNFRVFRREQMTKMNYSSTPRTGDLIIDPDAPYLVGVRAHPPHASGGNHGWDPVKTKAMHGVFFAVGPAFKEKAKLPTIDNVNIYPLVLEVLGLKQRVPIDGRLEPVKGALRGR